MDKEYIKIKIENCNYLIKNANSAAQKTVYQGYLKFWQKQIPKEPKPKEEPPEVDEVETIIEDLTEIQKAEEFEVKFPNRKAYYTREGKTYPTKAFQEFIKSSQ